MTRLLDPAADPSPASPDLVLDPRRDRLDFGLAGPGDRGNPMGLRARQTLATAFALQLLSDRRRDPDPTQRGQLDLRGWPGDGFDVETARGEAPLGSTLWTRASYPADADNAEAIARSAEAAFEPLVRQSLIGRVEATATASPALNRIALAVRLEAPDGRVIYDGPYAGLWEALLGVFDPLAP